MRSLRSSLAGASLTACAVLTPSAARADLTGDAARLVERWSGKEGTTVAHLAPLFLEHGHLEVVRLRADAKPAAAKASAAQPDPAKPDAAKPAAITPDATKPAAITPDATKPAAITPAATKPAAITPDATKPAKAGCTTVVLLAPRTSELAFLTDGEGAQPIPPPALPIGPAATAGASGAAEGGAMRSRAGVATIERCGKEQAAHPLENERALVQAMSARTAVEVLVVRSAAPIEEVQSILPEREVGPSAPRGDAGRPIDPGPLAERLARVEKRSREDGAAHVVKVAMRASAAGTGQFTAKVSEGCHALDVLADAPQPPARAIDIDAEVHASDGGRFLGRDRGEAPDARVDFCVGEATEVEVSFIGAAGPTAVTLVDSHWPLPASLPAEWGPQVRGDMALALRRRHAPALPAEPIATVMGVQGETMAPFEVEPGQCYLALVALVRGEARSLRLAVEIGDHAPHDEISERPEAAQVAFCATTEDRATLRIDARGAQPWWVAMLWRMTK